MAKNVFAVLLRRSGQYSFNCEPLFLQSFESKRRIFRLTNLHGTNWSPQDIYKSTLVCHIYLLLADYGVKTLLSTSFANLI
jgi:hypothetical protein